MKERVLFLVLFFSSVLSQGATFYVQPNGKINSVQKAIVLSRANDSIIVAGGIYRERTMVVDKPLFLIGIDDPVLDGEGIGEIISVRADHVVINGFRFLNSGYSDMKEFGAVSINNRKHIVVENNTFENTIFAVYLLGGKNCTIRYNIIRSQAVNEIRSGNGIHCWQSDSMTITDNTIEGHRDGIYFEFVTNSYIANNLSHKNIRYGLHFMFSHDNIYESNTFSDNGAGVAVMYSNRVTMINNIFSGNQGPASYGILMKEISDSHVERNHFLHNTTGIFLEGTNRVKMIRNEFSLNGYAMKMQSSCSGNEINENNFRFNTFDITTNGSLVLNLLRGNYWDKYEGYDLDRDGTGDVPYRPLSMFSMIIEQVPETMMVLHSFIVTLLDRIEKVVPGITPENFIDEKPQMQPLSL